jgi:hypothetical protein
MIRYGVEPIWTKLPRERDKRFNRTADRLLR